MSEQPNSKKPQINTFAVLVMECGGKQLLAVPDEEGYPYQFLTIPVPKHHLPAVEVIKFLHKTLGISKEAVGRRLTFGIIHQRYVSRVYYHTFGFELTPEELQTVANEGVPLVKMNMPEEYHPSIDKAHTDFFLSIRSTKFPSAGN